MQHLLYMGAVMTTFFIATGFLFEVSMYRRLVLIIGFVFLGSFVFAQTVVPTAPMSSVAQGIIKMAQAGVDESVMETYVRTSPIPFGLSAEDIVNLKAAGVSQNVIAEALHRDSSSQSTSFSAKGEITEDQLFRLYFGRIFYDGKAYSFQNGLDPTLQGVLNADPATQSEIQSFSRLLSTSRVLLWSGTGLILGGGIYSLVTASLASTYTGTEAGITFGAIGVGALTLMIGGITNQAAYQRLYNGLYLYNQDLITQNAKR